MKKLYKVITVRESGEKPEYTKVYALSESSLAVNNEIPGSLGRIKEKSCIGGVQVLDKTTKKGASTLYQVTCSGYGKTIYIVVDQPGINTVEEIALRYFHSNAVKQEEKDVNLQDADKKNYYTSIEELGKCFTF